MGENVTEHTQEDRALIIASNEADGQDTRQMLEHAGWRVEVCHDREELHSISAGLPPTLIIVNCGNDIDWQMAALESLQPWIASERTAAIVISATTSFDDVKRCARFGVMDYLAGPVEPEELLALAGRARKDACYAAANSPLLLPSKMPARNSIPDNRSLIGGSAAMLNLYKKIVRLAQSPDLRVFITGETGTGKEVVARLIHGLSGRSGPFLAVNCAATVESLLESDLFGHEKGAFTGAHATKRGLWEEAANGTIFLDEITETSPAVQAKLLRVLQEGVIRRVGSTREINVTARVIAASNRDLDQAIKEELFRQDLFYRLGQLVRLPPLRERLEDIPLLVDHFCRRISRPIVFTPEAIDALCTYTWPGNVRELESVIQQIVTFSGRFVFIEDVARHIRVDQDEQPKAHLPFWSAMRANEKEEWWTVGEFRKWYIKQAYLFYKKELLVAKKLGLDVRTVKTILWGEAAEAEDADQLQ